MVRACLHPQSLRRMPIRDRWPFPTLPRCLRRFLPRMTPPTPRHTSRLPSRAFLILTPVGSLQRTALLSGLASFFTPSGFLLGGCICAERLEWCGLGRLAGPSPLAHPSLDSKGPRRFATRGGTCFGERTALLSSTCSLPSILALLLGCLIPSTTSLGLTPLER